MPDKIKFGIVAMCDAVYKDERSNKAVLAGVYAGDVVAEAFPLNLPVAFYIEVIPPVGGSHQIDLRFFVNGKHKFGALMEVGNAIAGTPALVLLPPLTVGFDAPSTFEIRAVQDGGRAVSLLKKKVILRDPSATA